MTSDQVNSAVYDFTAKVTKTFELTLNGDVPAGQGFYVEYATPNYAPGGIQRLALCGPALGPERPDVDCVGNGTVYTKRVLFDRGTVLNFAFIRNPGGNFPPAGSQERFFEGSETLNNDMTNSAYYSFGATAPSTGEQETPAQLPDTGVELSAFTIDGALVACSLILLISGAILTFISRRRLDARTGLSVRK